VIRRAAAAVADALQRAPITVLLGSACLSVFLVMLRGARSFGFDAPTLLRFGALDPRATWTGQPWRVLTAALVHTDPLQLLFTLWSIAVLGELCERRLSAPRMALLVVGSQLGSADAVLCFSGVEPGRAGATGIVFGMMGALLVALLRREDPRIVAIRRVLPAMAAMTVCFSILPGGLIAHLGGLLAGAALMTGLDPTDDGPSRAPSVVFACALLSLMTQLSLVQPLRANWNMAQAEARYARGDCASALPFLRKTRAQGNGDFAASEVARDLGSCLISIGDRDGGLAMLAQATEEGSVSAARLWGDGEEDVHRALHAYARGLALAPADPVLRESLLRLVHQLADQGELPTAHDLAPLWHLPQLPELDEVRAVMARVTRPDGG
jgi:rhomboid protease GluP